MQRLFIILSVIALISLSFTALAQNDFDKDLGTYNQHLLPPYKHNTYGAGVHSDGSGVPYKYKTRDGDTLTDWESNNIKRDGYGLGVHADEYGRPVREKRLND